MNTATFGTVLLTVMIAGLLVGGVAIPLITDTTTETTTVENENPQWIRMAYLTDQTDYSVGYTIADSTITVTNGTDSQSGEVVDTILYADDTATVMVSDGDAILLANVNDEDNYATLGTSFTVTRSSGAVTVTDGEYEYNIGSDKTWAYVPLSTESYGVFSSGGLNRYESALACAGSYAGVYCYNDICSHDLGLVMDAEYTDDYITSVKWALAETETTEAESESTESSANSSVVLSTAAATGTYTDGDWSYNLSGSDATIVGYTGATGGALTIPATIGGYTVTTVGLGSLSNPVVDTTSTFTDLVISQGITIINKYAFDGCSGFTGTLTIPDSVTSIGMRAFNGCSGFTGTLTIPDSVTSMSTEAFHNCSSMTSLVLSNNLTTIESDTFYGCSGFTGTLTIPDSVTTIKSDAFSGCSGFTGTLTIPDGNATIYSNTFYACSGFTSLELPDSVTKIKTQAFDRCIGLTGTLILSENITEIGTYAFRYTGFDNMVVLSDATPTTSTFNNTTNLKEILNLGSAEYTTTSYGLNADSVQDHIDADSYLCITEVSETTQKEGAVYDVFMILPLVMITGVVIVAVYLFIRKN